MVLADVPPERKPERGTFGCSPGTKTGTRVRSDVPQEDVNGEKLTVKKWWIFGADFFHGLVPIFSRFTPIFHGL